jgi:hypothetical protein
MKVWQHSSVWINTRERGYSYALCYKVVPMSLGSRIGSPSVILCATKERALSYAQLKAVLLIEHFYKMGVVGKVKPVTALHP